MNLAIVLDLFVSFEFDGRTIFQSKGIIRLLEILLLDQDTLKRLRVKAKRRAALEALLIGIQVNTLEFLVGLFRRHVCGF